MKPPSDGLRAVIYTRISKDDGNTEGAGPIERQLDDCRKLVNLRRYELVSEESDRGVSAYREDKRPAWARVLELAKNGSVDVIVAWHIDRMTRNMADLERLILLAQDRDIAIATVTGDIDLTNENGRMVARILAAVARAEVERKASRQRSANETRAAEGTPWKAGWRPFGFNHDMTHVSPEADMVRKAARDVLAGASLKSIAREWRDSGVSTPRSDKGANGWTHNGVKSILLNARNAGLNTYKGEVVGPGKWEPIFDESTHHQLVALLTDSQRLLRRTGSNGRTASNLLTGIACCGTCSKTVVAGTSNGKPVYKCPSDHVSTSRYEADGIVVGAMALVASSTMPGLIFETPTHDGAADVLAELEALDKRQSEVAQAFAQGSIPLKAWEDANAAMNDQREALEGRLSEVDESLGTNRQALNKKAVERFSSLDLQGKRDVLRHRAEITLHPRNRKRNVPMREQVSVFLRVRDNVRGEWMHGIITDHPEAWEAMKAGRSIRSNG